MPPFHQPGYPALAKPGWASPHRPLCVLSVLVASFAHCSPLPAQPVLQQPLLQLVDNHYNHLKSLRTRYTERYTGMGLDRTETGTLLLKKPGRMAWHYDSPTGKVFLLDGKFAWFYTPGDAQVQRIPAKQMDDLRTPLRFLLGHTQLAKELDNVTLTPNSAGTLIAGTPKGMQNRIRQLSLQVTPTGEITAMKLEEVDGATTTFTFTDEHENVPAADSDFFFNPPPGVAIVNGTPPI
jgi:outer membrane lipoprotein carrier protein